MQGSLSSDKTKQKHKTVRFADFEYLPALVFDMKTECEEHSEKLEYFCQRHDSPLCVMCTVKHQTVANKQSLGSW